MSICVCVGKGLIYKNIENSLNSNLQESDSELSLPGIIFDGEHQCKLQFGRSDAKLCRHAKQDSDDFCHALW